MSGQRQVDRAGRGTRQMSARCFQETALSDICRPVGEYADHALLCVVLDWTVTERLWRFGIFPFSAFASMTLPDDQGTWAQSHIITLSTLCTQVGPGGPIELTPVEQRRLTNFFCRRLGLHSLSCTHWPEPRPEYDF